MEWTLLTPTQLNRWSFHSRNNKTCERSLLILSHSMKLGNNNLNYVCGRWGMLNSVSIVSEKCVFPIVPLSLLMSLSKTTNYYINTSEIPSERCCENFISSQVKITCYLHTWRDHRRYGYIINRAFESKLIWYFTGVYVINRILHARLWTWILFSRVHLDISLVRCAHSFDIELTTRR